MEMNIVFENDGLDYFVSLYSFLSAGWCTYIQNLSSIAGKYLWVEVNKVIMSGVVEKSNFIYIYFLI